jgi:formate-nitrite transporter family protein
VSAQAERSRGRRQRDVLDVEPSQLAERAAEVGTERLQRGIGEALITALIGGVEVSLGAMASMAVVGAALRANPAIGLYGALALGGLVFPIGFLFVIIGRSELFTENFLIPVAGVARREQRLLYLVRLWGLSWIGNLLACAAIALLLSVPETIGQPLLTGYRDYAAYKLSMSPVGVFTSGILAGTVMTVLTWILLAMKESIAKIAAIFAAGYVLFAANLSHSIVGAAIIFVGFHLAHRSVADVILWVLVASLGNLVGGVGFVTLFRYAQVRSKQALP